jgi:hypothetical protein
MNRRTARGSRRRLEGGDASRVAAEQAPRALEVPRARPAPARAGDLVDGMVARWQEEHREFLLVDPTGRHGEVTEGRVDLHRRTVEEPDEVDRLLADHGQAVLDAADVPVQDRTAVLGRALIAAQCSRARSGTPKWIVLEDAQDLLADPDLPPEALDLTDGGYCLVLRPGVRMPPALLQSVRRACDAAGRAGRPGVEIIEAP